MPARHQAGPSVPIMATDTPMFLREKHISYWLRCFRSPLPTQYTSMDSNRMALAFFTVAALDLLGILFTQVTEDERQRCIGWIYRCQHPQGGFRGFPGTDFGVRKTPSNSVWDPATVPATYFALGALAILGDDFTHVNKHGCLRWLNNMQRNDGSFGETLGEDGTIEGGRDARFGYCSMAIRWMLRGDNDGAISGIADINIDKLIECFHGSANYDGGISDTPFSESHAGFTYCTIAGCSFLNRLPQSNAEDDNSKSSGICSRDATVRWLLNRLTTAMEEPSEVSPDDEDDGLEHQIVLSSNEQSSGSAAIPHENIASFSKSIRQGNKVPMPIFDSPDPSWVGFNGRSNKIADTCYVWWAGSSLKMLDALEMVDIAPIKRYLLEKTQHLIAGGFGKVPGAPPDIYHAYLGLAILAILNESEAEKGEYQNSDLDGLEPVSEDQVLSENTAQSILPLRSVDAALCFSKRARKWIESFSWRH